MNYYGVFLIFFIFACDFPSGVHHNLARRINGTSTIDKYMNIDLSPTLRRVEIRQSRESLHTSDMPDRKEVLPNQLLLQTSEDSKKVNVGGMGLSLSDSKPISLGQLTSNFKEDKVHPLQSTLYKKPEDKQTWSEYNKFKFDRHIKRTMRNMEDTTRNENLQPDINSRLIRRLWSFIQNMDDKHWTSEELPRILRQRALSGMMSDESTSIPSPIDKTLVRHAQALNFTFRDQSGSRFLLPESQIQIFRDWLVQQATCEMDFVWKDLGSLYWPRWIKMGICLTRSGGSCSWPPGMKCQPSGSRVLRLLNWNCAETMQLEPKSEKVKRSSRAVVNLPLQNINSFRSENPVINLRSHLMSSDISSERLNIVNRKNSKQPRNGISFRTPSRYYSTKAFGRYNNAYRRKERRDAYMSSAEEEDRKLRRAKRLMEKLSVNSSNFHCSWQIQKYLISDKCSCTCT